MDTDVVIENLTELLTNSVNMTSQFWDIFINPEPKLVTIQMYNDQNKLIKVTIPNRAKDLKNIKTGDESPNNSVEAEIGTLYIDSSIPQLYIKTDTTIDSWVAIPNVNDTEEILKSYLETNNYVTEQYLEDNNYAKTSDIGNGTVTIIQDNNEWSISMNQSEDVTISLQGGGGSGGTVDQEYRPTSANAQSGVAIAGAGFLQSFDVQNTYNATSESPISGKGVANAGFLTSIPQATTSAIGGVKYDDSSITLNSSSQVQVNGVIEQHNSSTEKFWVGTEDEYTALTTKDPNTIYIIKDTES